MDNTVSLCDICFKSFNIYDNEFKKLFFNYVDNYFQYLHNDVFTITPIENIFFKIKFYNLLIYAINNIISNIYTPKYVKIILNKYCIIFNYYLQLIKDFLDFNLNIKNYLENKYFIENEQKISLYFMYIIDSVNKIDIVKNSNNNYLFFTLLQHEFTTILNL